MPYISRKAREELEYRPNRDPATPGELSYFLTQVILNYLDTKKIDYAMLAQVLGVLEATKLEIVRRMIVPYEDAKIQDSGDVF